MILTKILFIVIFQAVFLLIYYAVFRKETFYTINRVYLIISFLISFVLPFISIHNSTVYEIRTQILPEIIVHSQQNFLSKELLQTLIFSWTFLLFTYLLGVVVFSLFFRKKILFLYNLIRENSVENHKEYKIVWLPESTKVFSFFSYIFIGKNISKSSISTLIQHEYIHISQKHSYDLFFFEFFKIVLWFNPLVYVYQKEIMALHEYIADQKSIKKIAVNTYFNYLLNDLFQVENIAFINQFYQQSLLKKRIIMMTKNKSQKWQKVKYVFLFPILFAIVLLNCESKKETPNSTILTTESITNKAIVPFSSVVVPPLFPECDANADKEIQKKCFSKKIMKFVGENFNVDLANKLGLKPGKKRIFVKFKIDASGHVGNIKARAPAKELEIEAIRIIKMLPEMIPGKDENGQKVAVSYTLPITFLIE